MVQTSQVKIRNFQMKDYDETVQLWKNAGLEIRPGDEKREIEKKLERDPELFLVAEDTDGSLVGTVLGSWDGRRGWIHHLAVRPDRQHTGLGSKIVEELEGRMKKKGVLKVNAIVYRTNMKSINFFTKHGYEHHEQDLFFGKLLAKPKK
jgi:ribosomal protein S18 acetylase RimI-like enzyme